MPNFILRFCRPAMVPQGPADGAAGYPSKAIRFIVPYAVGGPGDLLARLIAQRLSERWKKPVNIENIPGRGGMNGSAIAINLPADGHTLILAASPHAINPSLYTNIPYDTVRDFQPVTLMVSMPNVLIVNKDLPVSSVPDLVAYAKANPGELKYASGGIGTPSHLGAELLKTMTGVDIGHAEYKGHAPAGAAVLAGEASLMFDAIILALPEARAGKVKALAVTSAKRSKMAPDIPSVSESGVPGFDFSPGAGILVRAGTPPAIVDKLHAELVGILQVPEVKARLAQDGAEVVANSPQEFSAYIKREIEKWAKVVKAANIPPQ